jgi:AAA ATPase domain
MITGMTIENFKGIRDRVKLDFRPITLLFGANSAGKSTVLHALHYAREVFERHNLDADQTIAGGKYIDLGGFRRLVHRNDDDAMAAPETPIRLRIDVDVTRNDLKSFYPDIDGLIARTVADLEPDRNQADARVLDEIGWLMD